MLNFDATYSSPTESRCCPMRRTISWSVSDIRGPGGCTSPLRATASPLTWGAAGSAGAGAGVVPLVAGCCMAGSAGSAGAGGDTLRDRLRGGRWPAPSSPESLEARLGADCARGGRRRTRALLGAEITAASAPLPQPRDVTAARNTPPALNWPSLFVRHWGTLP